MTCGRAQEFLGRKKITPRQVADAKRERLGAQEALALAGEMHDLYVAKGHKVVHVDFSLSNAVPETPLAACARVAKAEHRIEECRQRSKSEAGLADYEVRNWTGWHHHQTLSLIATWFLVTETHRGKKMDPCDDIAPDSRGHRLALAHRVSVRDDTAYAA